MNKIDEAFKLINLLYNYNKYEAYLVGGSVRDLLMERKIKDNDITTNATPEQIIEVAKQNNLKYIETGIKHGTVTVIYNDIPMEVTTFRVDKNCDGRHCNVEFVKTLKEDLSRRDFTINAMAIDKNWNLIDLFEGQFDIESKIIRTVGNPKKRFAEDKLRLLRAIRFATVLNFTIEEDTWNGFKEFEGQLKIHSDHEIIEDEKYYWIYSQPVSDERIRDEIEKILLSSNRIKGIRLLDASGMLSEILPEIISLKGVTQAELHHPEKDTFVHTMLALDSLFNKDEDKWDEDNDISLELILGILLHDIGKPQTRNFESETEIHFYEHEKVGAEISEVILKKLKFTTKTIEKVKWLVANHMRIHHFDDMKKSKKVSLIEHEYFPDLVRLAIADINGSSGLNETTTDYEVIYNIEKFVNEYTEEVKNRPALQLKLINGYDVMNLGVSKSEGIKIGQILEKVNDVVIEGVINTKEEALEFVKGMI